jgi:4-methyl-5(b-hydroxyethyl)-thiazole monophosphate biosynthesis
VPNTCGTTRCVERDPLLLHHRHSPHADGSFVLQVLREILEKQRSAQKPIAAICAAPQVVLDAQGMLEGRRATAHPAFSGKLTNQESVDQRVVVDDKFITSRGPGTAFEFALSLVKLLFDEAKAEEVAGPMVMYDGWREHTA